MQDYSDGNSLYFIRRLPQNSGDYYSSFILYNFIKYFEIKGENIIIYYSKGKITIPYTKTYEKELLEKMREQVMSWYEISMKSKRLKKYFKLLSRNSFLSFKFKKGYEYSLMYEDYLKNILYCKNEDLINANIREKMSELGIATDVYVTINDAHFLSMEEVENLIDGDINSNLVYKLRKK